MAEQYYQVHRDVGGFICLAELVEGKTCTSPAPQPENPNIPEG